MTGNRRRAFGSVRRLPSGRWQGRFVDPSGEPQTRVFPTKGGASTWLSTVEADLARGDWINPRLGEMRFRDWAQEWLETAVHLRPKTRSAYESILRTHVQPRLGQVPVGTVTPMHVRRFVADMAEHGAAPGTIRNAYRLVHMLLGGAVHAGLIRSNPAFGIRLPQSERAEMVFLAPPQISRLADAVGEPYGFLVTFAAYTGLRAGEIAGLRRGRVDLDRRVLDVVETIAEADGRLVSGPTKTHQRRTVPLPEFLATELEARLALRPLDPQALVFTAPDGGPVRHGNFYSRHFRPGVTRAGLPAMRFHDLRHSCAAMLIAQGAHPKAIAEMLGHSTITVTIDRYGHLFPSITQELAARLDELHRHALDVVEPPRALPPGAPTEPPEQ